MIRKELHLDSKIIKILESEAKRQNRSLKNYLENLAIEQANRLNVPSNDYMQMMDKMLKEFNNGDLKFSRIEDVLKRNEISD